MISVTKEINFFFGAMLHRHPLHSLYDYALTCEEILLYTTSRSMAKV